MVFSGFQGYPLLVASLILFRGKAAGNRSFGELTVSPELNALVNSNLLKLRENLHDARKC